MPRGVDLPEAQVRLITLPFVGSAPLTAQSRAEGRVAVEALAARVAVVESAEIEGELAEGRPDTAVEVDFGRGAVREADARAGDADIELQIRIDVVARLEIGRERSAYGSTG